MSAVGRPERDCCFYGGANTGDVPSITGAHSLRWYCQLHLATRLASAHARCCLLQGTMLTVFVPQMCKPIPVDYYSPWCVVRRQRRAPLCACARMRGPAPSRAPWPRRFDIKRNKDTIDNHICSVKENVDWCGPAARRRLACLQRRLPPLLQAAPRARCMRCAPRRRAARYL